jgi:hypothetical protein
MTPTPITLGLTLCEKVIVEEGTRNVTLVSTFNKPAVSRFPTPPKRFDVFAALTDGVGDATIKLTVTSLATDEMIYEREAQAYFPNRLAEVHVLFRVGECSFPAPGFYQVSLLLDGEWVAQRRLQLIERQVSS